MSEEVVKKVISFKEYSTFSGADIRVYWKLQGEEDFKVIGECQNVDFSCAAEPVELEPVPTGQFDENGEELYEMRTENYLFAYINLSLIEFGGGDFVTETPLKVDEIYAIAANEYGNVKELFRAKDLVFQSYNSKFSSDDIMIERKLSYKGLAVHLGKLIHSNTSLAIKLKDAWESGVERAFQEGATEELKQQAELIAKAYPEEKIGLEDLMLMMVEILEKQEKSTEE